MDLPRAPLTGCQDANSCGSDSFSEHSARCRPGQCGSPDRAQRPTGRERHPRRDRREPSLVGGVRGAHELPRTQRLRGRLAHRGARAPRLQRRRQAGRRAARCSPTRRRSAWTRTGRRPRSTSRSCSRRSCRCPAPRPGCIYTWPGYKRPEPPTLALYTYPGDGVIGATSPYLYALGVRRRGRRGHAVGRVAHRAATARSRVNVDRQPHPGRGGLPPAGRHPRPRRAAGGRQHATPRRSRSPPTRALQATRRWTLQHRRAGRGDRGADRRGRHRGDTHRRAAAERPHAADDARPARRSAAAPARRSPPRATPSAARARVTLQRLDCRCRPTKRTFRLTRTARRFESRGRPVRVTVSLSGFFADEIPYRGLTLVRTLS